MRLKLIPYSWLLFALLLGASSGWAQEIISVKATQTTPRTAAAYQFMFTTEQDLLPNAEIDIVFPSYFILSKTVLADSRAINGGFSVAVKNDTVRVKRSGMGSVVPKGRTVDLLLASIINPREMAPNYEFGIIIRSANAPVLKKKFNSGIAELKASIVK